MPLPCGLWQVVQAVSKVGPTPLFSPPLPQAQPRATTAVHPPALLKAATDAPFYLHELHLPVLHELPERVRLWLDMEVDPLDDPDGYLNHGDRIAVGDEELEVRFTPGHAPGHVVFVDHAGRQVFAGDTLFRDSIGRYDLPGADGPTLFASIRAQLFTLPDDYTVYPGHGPATTIGYERAHNPFVGDRANVSGI